MFKLCAQCVESSKRILVPFTRRGSRHLSRTSLRGGCSSGAFGCPTPQGGCATSASLGPQDRCWALVSISTRELRFSCVRQPLPCVKHDSPRYRLLGKSSLVKRASASLCRSL